MTTAARRRLMRDFKRLQVGEKTKTELLVNFHNLARRIPLPGLAVPLRRTTSCSGMPLYLGLMKLHSRLVMIDDYRLPLW